MRILNREQVVSHGFEEGRRIVTDIMEHGLQAADPYVNTSRLLHLEGNRLYVGDARFEADHDPQKGMSVYDLTQIENVYIVGAGKGVQRVAKALEEALGDHLTGGCVIAKHGDPLILEKTEVVFGAHPIPDEGCVKGCERIKALSSKVTEKDLVFTIIGNGGSSLLTMPEEGISLEDVKRLTAMMQIQKGVTTIELNAIRNHVDQMKGGKMTRLFSRAQCVHIVITDANHHVIQAPRHDYEGLMTGNVWLHNLPEGSTFADAVEILHRYDAWEECPQSIRDHCSERTRPLKRSSLRSSEITVSACSALCLMQSISCRQLCGAPENWAFPAISLHSFCRRNPASAPVSMRPSPRTSKRLICPSRRPWCSFPPAKCWSRWKRRTVLAGAIKNLPCSAPGRSQGITAL